MERRCPTCKHLVSDEEIKSIRKHDFPPDRNFHFVHCATDRTVRIYPDKIMANLKDPCPSYLKEESLFSEVTVIDGEEYG